MNVTKKGKGGGSIVTYKTPITQKKTQKTSLVDLSSFKSDLNRSALFDIQIVLRHLRHSKNGFFFLTTIPRYAEDIPPLQHLCDPSSLFICWICQKSAAKTSAQWSITTKCSSQKRQDCSSLLFSTWSNRSGKKQPVPFCLNSGKSRSYCTTRSPYASHTARV